MQNYPYLEVQCVHTCCVVMVLAMAGVVLVVDTTLVGDAPAVTLPVVVLVLLPAIGMVTTVGRFGMLRTAFCESEPDVSTVACC